jgi:CubicO group peptidase (beta-lactamase class C family)
MAPQSRSKERVHLRSLVEASVAAGEVVGAVVMVSRHGEVVDTVVAGYADREHSIPMTVSTVFRIASMTKVMVSVAVLALCDDGVLGLDQPVTRWLPDFTPTLPDGSRPVITIRHLLTHTAGLGYTFTEPLDGAFHRLGISDGLTTTPTLTLAENVALVGRAPLAYAPGSAWAYSIATDVLGAVVEAATGDSLPHIVRTRVSEPIGMISSSFCAAQGAPLAAPYAATESGVVRMGEPHVIPFLGSEIRYSPSRAWDSTAWPSAGTGMVSTASDYLRFAEAMRRGGAPVLRPTTTQLMTANALGNMATDAGLGLGPGLGFGLGVSVVLNPAAAGLPGNPGSWGWGGVYGTHFFVDPLAAISVVCLTNTALTGMAGPFPLAVRDAVYRDSGMTSES